MTLFVFVLIKNGESPRGHRELTWFRFLLNITLKKKRPIISRHVSLQEMSNYSSHSRSNGLTARCSLLLFHRVNSQRYGFILFGWRKCTPSRRRCVSEPVLWKWSLNNHRSLVPWCAVPSWAGPGCFSASAHHFRGQVECTAAAQIWDQYIVNAGVSAHNTARGVGSAQTQCACVFVHFNPAVCKEKGHITVTGQFNVSLSQRRRFLDFFFLGEVREEAGIMTCQSHTFWHLNQDNRLVDLFLKQLRKAVNGAVPPLTSEGLFFFCHKILKEFFFFFGCSCLNSWS